MTVYTTTEARRRLVALLKEAARDGSVRIKGRDGREFELVPVERGRSPLDVQDAGLDLTADEIVAAIREGRERG